jgi:3-hydroxyisobutyrate dehydrogenase
MNPTAPPPVAVIGLGRMGAGMAECLLSNGFPVAVWNRTMDRAQELVVRGATPAATPAAAAKDSELVLVSVADAAATREVLYGPDGVLSGGPLAGVLASTSTLAPEEMALLAERTPAVLEVGLLGNHRHAAAGELRLLVGGAAPLLERVRPVLTVLAREVIHVGPLGAGMKLKVLMNLLMGVQMQAMAEAVALGEGQGLDRRLVLDVISNSGFASPVMAFKARRMATGDYTGPDFRLRLMTKDLQLAVASAGQVGLELPLAHQALRTHDTAVAQGHGDLDCAAITYAVGTPGRGRR